MATPQDLFKMRLSIEIQVENPASTIALLHFKACSLQGRTDQQCMGRWKRHLDPTITREAWTDAEDATLHDQFVLYGSQWSSIARMLPGRTAQQCRAR